MKAIYDWTKVNWEDQDIIISKKLGCSRERVRQKRKDCGQARSKFYHRKNYSLIAKIVDFDTHGKTIEELCKKFKCKSTYLSILLRELKKDYLFVDHRLGGKYEWEKADWSKTDRQVAAYLGVPNPGTVTQHRRRVGIIKHRVPKISAKKDLVKRIVWVGDVGNGKSKELVH